MEAMVLVFLAIIAILAIYLGCQLTYVPDMPVYEEDSRAQQEEEDFTE